MKSPPWRGARRAGWVRSPQQLKQPDRSCSNLEDNDISIDHLGVN
jgi:hypothetical protein